MTEKAERSRRWVVVTCGVAFALTSVLAIVSEFAAFGWSESFERPWPSSISVSRSTLVVWVHRLRPGTEAQVPQRGIGDRSGFWGGPNDVYGSARALLPAVRSRSSDTAHHLSLRLPAWCVLLPLSVPLVGEVGRRWVRTPWRRRRGCCIHCGYTRQGEPVCPECGRRAGE